MKRDNLTVNIGFTNGAGDQLGVLAAKIEDEDLFCHGAKVNEFLEVLNWYQWL